MRIKGIVRTGTLEENPPGSDRIEMTLKVQGVGAGQPRTLVVPYDLLLGDNSLDPDEVAGKGFEADAEPETGRAMGCLMDCAGDRAGLAAAGGVSREVRTRIARSELQRERTVR